MFNDKLLLKMFKIFGFVVLAFVVARMFYLQVIKHNYYSRIVEAQSAAKSVFVKDRGLILDKLGRPLAQNKKSASLYVFGKDVDDVDVLEKELKENGLVLKSNVKKNIEEKSGFVWIERHLDVKTAENIKSNVKKVNYYLEDTRTYPEGNMLAGIIGYTGVDNQGLAGVEYHADKILEGKVIPANVKKDSRGGLIIFDEAIQTKPDSAVYLTIDVQMQALAEQILKEDLEKYGAKSAVALAMDVQKGDIVLAAAVMKKNGKINIVSDKNYATMYLFEPGSIFKAVTFAYLIENGLYKADGKVDTSKQIDIYGHKIKDVYAYKSLTQKEVFMKSSNIGTVILTSKVKHDDFYNHMQLGGFGKKTGIEGASEEAGVLREPKKWSGLSLASLSFGQEIMVSPLQMVRYYAAIANGGIAAKPRIIDHYMVDNQYISVDMDSERFMSENTAKTLLDMLEATVNTGTGKQANTNILKVGGKTGTAQLMDPKTNAYSKTNYIATFAGVFPIDDPKMAMIILYESPQASIYGGATGAVTFRKIAEQIAFFYNLGNESTKVLYASK